MLSVNFEEFRVAGVVEDASYLLDRIYAQIWYPYTYNKDWEMGELRNAERNPGLGSFYCYALVKEGASLREAQERLRRTVPPTGTRWARAYLYRTWCAGLALGERLPLLLGCGLGSRRRADALCYHHLLPLAGAGCEPLGDGRLPDGTPAGRAGPRRAFGAPRANVLGQVLVENLLYTVLGGLAGLLFSFLVAGGCARGCLRLATASRKAIPDGVEVSPLEGLLNPWIFTAALLVCFLLNLMSALWPAWRLSRRPDREFVERLNG